MGVTMNDFFPEPGSPAALFAEAHPYLDLSQGFAMALLVMLVVAIAMCMFFAIESFRTLEFSPRYQRGREAQYLWNLQTSMGLTGNAGQGRAQPYADRSTPSTSVTPDSRTDAEQSVPPLHLSADWPEVCRREAEQAVLRG